MLSRNCRRLKQKGKLNVYSCSPFVVLESYKARVPLRRTSKWPPVVIISSPSYSMAFNVRNEKALTKVLDHDTLPYKVLKLQDVKIPLKDGNNLRAHIWIPEDAYDSGDWKVGSLVEYIPYRADVTIQRDAIRHPWYAGNGLASMRIDMRGASSSDGVLEDEYLKIEQDDALDAFDWIIRQPWSNGSIAMFGKSWGGFNGLQVAARQHPALKTIITLMSTDDRYTDDVHYRGGCLLASDMLWWGSTMSVYGPRPQDPKVVGASWKQNWLERLRVEPMVKNWLEHQTKDDYWKHGSINQDYSKVDIPVLAIGGWRDGYTSPVFRMVDNLPNCYGIVGPWVHEYPEMAEPSPKIGYQQLSLAWFKKYLDSGGDIQLPKLTAYLQDPSDIKSSYSARKGEWISTDDPKLKTFKILHLDSNNRLSESPKKVDYKFAGVLSHGLFRGTYCPFGFNGDFPADQRVEDAKCLNFEIDVNEELKLFGEPKLKLRLSSDKKFGNLSAKLTDVYPDNGENILISWGQLNLTHFKSHETPEWLEPNVDYDIELKLDVLGIKLKPGHKLKLSLSTTDWPQNWPTPEIPTFRISKGELVLPLVNERKLVTPPTFEGPTIMKGIKTEIIKPYDRIKQTIYDYSKDEWTLVDVQDSGIVRIHDFQELSGIYHGSWNKNIYSIVPYDPLSAKTECFWTYDMGRDDWKIKLDSHSKLTADENNFYLKVHLKAFENEEEIFDEDWNYTITRTYI